MLAPILGRGRELRGTLRGCLVEPLSPRPQAFVGSPLPLPRFSHTIRIPTSEGDTPEIRDACPSVAGRISASLTRASVRRLGTCA